MNELMYKTLWIGSTCKWIAVWYKTHYLLQITERDSWWFRIYEHALDI